MRERLRKDTIAEMYPASDIVDGFSVANPALSAERVLQLLPESSPSVGGKPTLKEDLDLALRSLTASQMLGILERTLPNMSMADLSGKLEAARRMYGV